MAQIPHAEWRDALRQCTASRSLGVLREHVLLVYVDPREAFHPLHALLPRVHHKRARSGATAFVAIVRLHASVATLLQELLQQYVHAHAASDTEIETAQLRQDVLESLVFADRSVDATSAKRAFDADKAAVARAVPLFYPCEVNLSSGALCTLVPDEASARAVLADITRAVQSPDALDVLDDDDRALVVVVEHDTGYVAQHFAGRVVASVTHITKRTLDEPDSVTLDSVLETYEADFVEQLELAGEEHTQPEQLIVRVHAGFPVQSALTQRLSGTDTCRDRRCATLLSSWSGIENIRSLGCKPPPNAMSLVSISGRSKSADDALFEPLHSPPASLTRSARVPFPVCVQQTIRLLANLERSVDDSTFEWRGDSHQATASDSEQSGFARALQQFLRAPETSSTTSTRDPIVDSNHTLELKIALDAARDSEELASSVRTDLDFLERLWEFALANVMSAEMAVTTVRELLATLVGSRALPFVHPDNATRLGAVLKKRAEASIDRAGHAAALLEHEQSALSSPREALLALTELGAWKLERDVVAWLAQIGFAAAESAQIVAQLELQALWSDSAERQRRIHARATTQELVDVCALAWSLGMSGSLLRQVVSDCLESATKRERDTDAPAFAVPLSGFVPDRIRANLGDALFWDLEVAFSELIERRVRVCEASFHATCSPSQLLERGGGSAELLEFASAYASADSALVLTSETLAQLERQLPADMLQLPVVQVFLQQQEERQTLDDTLPLASRLVLYESTTRTLLD